MTKLILILAATFAASAHAEFYPSNLFYRIGAGVMAVLGDSYHWRRSVESDPIFRPVRVPLQDVRPCEQSEPCVYLNGRKVDLEPTPAPLMHGRTQVVGQSNDKSATTVYARVRFGSWMNSDPDFLHVWAVIPHPGRTVKIVGYSIQRDEDSGVENEALTALSDLSLYKFLTSQNAVEVEVARELTGRRVFCTKYPELPIDSIRDDVAPLEAHGLIGDDEAQSRLKELNAIAAVLDLDRGKIKCESPITDQLDIVLDQVRMALQDHVDRTAKEARHHRQSEPAKPVDPSPVVIPAPSPAPPTDGIPFLSPPKPAT